MVRPDLIRLGRAVRVDAGLWNEGGEIVIRAKEAAAAPGDRGYLSVRHGFSLWFRPESGLVVLDVAAPYRHRVLQFHFMVGSLPLVS